MQTSRQVLPPTTNMVPANGAAVSPYSNSQWMNQAVACLQQGDAVKSRWILKSLIAKAQVPSTNLAMSTGRIHSVPINSFHAQALGDMAVDTQTDLVSLYTQVFVMNDSTTCPLPVMLYNLAMATLCQATATQPPGTKSLSQVTQTALRQGMTFLQAALELATAPNSNLWMVCPCLIMALVNNLAWCHALEMNVCQTQQYLTSLQQLVYMTAHSATNHQVEVFLDSLMTYQQGLLLGLAPAA